MNCNQANRIPLYELMVDLGVNNTDLNDRDAWFLSPFRNEKKASLKVNRIKNVWCDHGSDLGGTVIDFIIILKNCDEKEALAFLRNSNHTPSPFSFHQQKIFADEEKLNYEIVEITGLNDTSLLNYLLERKIDINIAKQYCKEMHYYNKKIKTQNDNNVIQQSNKTIKLYKTIAFENDQNGWETRNRYFPRCFITKAITTISKSSDILNVFEGFMDFLSYLSLMPQKSNEDFLILNTTAKVSESLKLLNQYNHVKTFLDNDDSGQHATRLIEKSCQVNFQNMSIRYENFNDVNDYLRHLKK